MIKIVLREKKKKRYICISFANLVWGYGHKNNYASRKCKMFIFGLIGWMDYDHGGSSVGKYVHQELTIKEKKDK